MKNILYTIILSFLFSSVCLADEWLELAKNQQGDTFWFDPYSIQTKNGLVYIWEMTNYYQRTNGFLSSKSLREYDCNSIPKKYRTLSIDFYRGPMATGTPQGLKPNEWNYPRPNSTRGAIFDAICKR